MPRPVFGGIMTPGARSHGRMHVTTELFLLVSLTLFVVAIALHGQNL